LQNILKLVLRNGSIALRKALSGPERIDSLFSYVKVNG